MKVMKNNILILFCLAFFLSSCDDFLEYKDKDKVIPNKLEHYHELIFGEVLLKDATSALVYLDFMTDDVQSYVSDKIYSSAADGRDRYYGYYTWAIEPQRDINSSEIPDKCWEFFYHKVLMCNIIEHDVNELEDDLEGVKERLLGEVRFMRALSYFYLVNMFGAPYEDEAQAKTAMGIPLNKEVGVYDKQYTRSTLWEVYEQIEKDLLAAQKNFEQGEDKKTMFRPNLHAVNILLSRVYLFEKRYQEAINAATLAITHSGASIEPIANFPDIDYFYYRKNTGIVFSWGRGEQGPLSADYYKEGRYIIAKDFIRQFVGNDVRINGFLDSYQGTYYPKKTNGSEIYRWAIRIEEAYLNRAEAYIELGKDWQKGVEDVNMVRSNRIENFENKTIAKVEDARDYCRLERRLEFCFEDFRWFDIRRWGLEVTHRYENFPYQDSYKEFKLTRNSPNYILPIPLDEQENNSKIERPKRVDCEVKQ